MYQYKEVTAFDNVLSSFAGSMVKYTMHIDDLIVWYARIILDQKTATIARRHEGDGRLTFWVKGLKDSPFHVQKVVRRWMPKTSAFTGEDGQTYLRAHKQADTWLKISCPNNEGNAKKDEKAKLLDPYARLASKPGRAPIVLKLGLGAYTITGIENI